MTNVAVLPKLEIVATPLIAPQKKPAKIGPGGASFRPWLDKHAGRELREWNTFASKHGLLPTYRGEFSAAEACTFTDAIRAHDGCWVARVRSVFCAVSPILEEDEEMHLATWWSPAGRASLVFYTHQDEDEIQSPSASIASFLVRCYERSFDEAPAIDAKWKRAAKALDRKRHKIPAHLDPVFLQERVRWIQGLFMYVGDRKIFGDGWDTMPSIADYEKERKLLKAWPHLQAYWLLHHLVLDNRDELEDLVKLGDARYPAVKELATWATTVLAGKKIKDKVWNEPRIAGFRLTAAEKRPDALTKRAERVRKGRASTDPKAALKADPLAAKVLQIFEIGEECAGNVPGLEQALGKQADSEVQMKIFMWTRRGNATVLRSYLWALTEHVDGRFRALFEPIVQGGAKVDEAHAKNIPGALAGLGVAIGEWDPYVAFVRKLLGDPAKLGRLRRLEIAIAAQRLLDRGATEAGPLAFLRAEATRWAKQIDAFQVDTAMTAFTFLLRRRDATAFALFNEMYVHASYSGANWTSLLALVQIALEEVPDKGLLPGLRAAAKNGLGRYDDGDSALVWRTLAACGESAAKIEALGKGGDSVRVDCARASVVAGLLQAEGTKHAKAAKEVLAKLVAKSGSMENGAAISMLQAAHAKGVKGFDPALQKLRANAKRDKYTKKSLAAWLEANAAALA